MMSTTELLIAALIASLLTAGTMTVLGLPGSMLPIVLVMMLAATAMSLRGLESAPREPPLAWYEWALITFAVFVGLLRLVPYAYQYASGVLVAPLTWDDNWHIQEIASLVNADRFPPRLNFQPDRYFHFYYVPWVPAAAISSLAQLLTGTPMIKLGLALGALLLDVGIAWGLIVVVRHFCSPRARLGAVAALLVAGAAVDGFLALLHFAVRGYLYHPEWWQLGFLVRNSFSALSASFIWVPHHLIAGVAMLLAVVVATEPVTLRPREDRKLYVVAGLLIAVAAFSSVFACAGALIALSPLLVELIRSGDRGRLGCLLLGAALPALPLAYIYLGSDARGGFVVGQAFSAWAGETGRPLMGIVGVAVAFTLMMLEVGWLYAIGRWLDLNGYDGQRLRRIALVAAVVLTSTAIIGFSGSNNWALRGTIVPVVLLACYAGRGLAQAFSERGSLLSRKSVAGLGAAALGLAIVAHLNEVALRIDKSVRAPAFASEAPSCKAAIMAINTATNTAAVRDAASEVDGAGCRDKLSTYHIERRFYKRDIEPEDRELMGRGFGFLGSGNASAR